MAARGNAAYDLSVYEPKRQPVQGQQGPSIQHKKNPRPVAKRESAFKFFIKAVVCLGILCAVLYGKVETNALFSDIHDLERQLKELKSENITLEAEYQSRTSLKNVEDYAENVLGLKKLDKSQIEYIDMPGQSVIEIVETENKNIFIIIRNKLNELREYLGA